MAESSVSSWQRFVVIRPFSPGDEIDCKRIAGESVMATVRRTFFSALLRETTFQLMIFFAAILFIIVGVPFVYCAVSAPLTVVFLYLAIWSSTAMKSMEMQNEISLVKQQYQNSDKTECFVAEYYGPMIDFDNRASITFVTPSSLPVSGTY